ncbi:unnamed protein product [Haemonchus placei]|uniref:7TM_GPCR_Srx domain-containing protein n=1 Tax=Haemonchus placei TaxID=6290 RepID=A0A0N4VUI2_HAEPC|nr:unnamed protein product [Haemonchus placei]
MPASHLCFGFFYESFIQDIICHFMFRTYEHGCKQYKPTLRRMSQHSRPVAYDGTKLVCSALSFTICICEFALAIYEYSYSRGGNLSGAIFTCVFSIHGCITLLYFVGIIKRNPCLLVPFLTLQVSQVFFLKTSFLN